MEFRVYFFLYEFMIKKVELRVLELGERIGRGVGDCYSLGMKGRFYFFFQEDQ